MPLFTVGIVILIVGSSQLSISFVATRKPQLVLFHSWLDLARQHLILVEEQPKQSETFFFFFF